MGEVLTPRLAELLWVVAWNADGVRMESGPAANEPGAQAVQRVGGDKDVAIAELVFDGVKAFFGIEAFFNGIDFQVLAMIVMQVVAGDACFGVVVAIELSADGDDRYFLV